MKGIRRRRGQGGQGTESLRLPSGGAASSRHSPLAEAWATMGASFIWRTAQFHEMGGFLRWWTRDGKWVPVDSHPAGDCQRCQQQGDPCRPPTRTSAHLFLLRNDCPRSLICPRSHWASASHTPAPRQCPKAYWAKQVHGGSRPVLPLASARSDMIRWSRVLLSHTLDAARSN